MDLHDTSPKVNGPTVHLTQKEILQFLHIELTPDKDYANKIYLLFIATLYVQKDRWSTQNYEATNIIQLLKQVIVNRIAKGISCYL